MISMPTSGPSYASSGYSDVAVANRPAGWWALGLRTASPTAFDGVPMSSPDTCAHQLRRLVELGLSPALIKVVTDVDTWEDALEVAATAPGTQFATMIAHLSDALPSDYARPRTR